MSEEPMRDEENAVDLDVDCDRHSQLQLGSYSTAGFRARLAKSRAPIEGATDPSFAVFVHEYWHHLHNVTTLAGMERFRAIQVLLALFSKTLNPDSVESVGSRETLSPDDMDQLRDYRDFLKKLEGEKGPATRTERGDLEAKVVGVDGALIAVDILKQGTVVGTTQFVLGAKAIEESVAFLVERMVSDAEKAPCAQAPEFPYWVVTRLAEYFLGSPPSDAILVGLATLSLLSNTPGSQLVTFLREFGLYRTRASDLAALRAVVENTRSMLRGLVAYATPILDATGDMHHERGMSEKAVKTRCSEYLRALGRRSYGPLFDVEGFLEPRTAGPVAVHIGRLMQDYPPPSFTLVAEEDENGVRGVDEMIAFGDHTEDEHGFQLPQYERAFEAQAHFMLAHLSRDGFKASTEVSAKCPFMSTCPHDLMKLDTDTCSSRPWRHITNPRAERGGCWYTSGALGLLGTVRFSKVDKNEVDGR